MKYLLALFISLSSFAAVVEEDKPVSMKWITVKFHRDTEVTLKGKMKVEKDCNNVFLQNQQLTLISRDRYFLSVDQVQTTMGCPDTKKTTVELDLQTFTLMNEKRNSIQILVPAEASFTIEQKRK